MIIIIIIIMASDAQLVSEKNNIDRLSIRQVYLYHNQFTISFIASTNPFRVTNFSHWEDDCAVLEKCLFLPDWNILLCVYPKAAVSYNL